MLARPGRLIGSPFGKRAFSLTPAEIYLGSETSGLAIDFAQNSALVREDFVSGDALVNGDFLDGTSGWACSQVDGSTISIVSGKLRVTASAGNANTSAYQVIAVEAGRLYELTVEYAGGTTTVPRIRVADGNSPTPSSYLVNNAPSVGLNVRSFVPLTNEVVVLLNVSQASSYGEYVSASIRQVDRRFSGAPVDLLTYTSPSPKMVYGADGVLRYARHNLLQRSQEFDNATWTKAAVTVVANQAIAPDGTISADLFYPTSSGVGRQILQQRNIAAGAIGRASIYVKYGGKQWISLSAPRANSESDSVFFDVLNGIQGTVGANVLSSNIEAIGNGWYRLTVTGLCDGVSDYLLCRLVDGDAVGTATPSGTDGVYIWGAQLQQMPCHDDTYLPTTSAARFDMPLDHDPVTHEAKGVLIEEQRTNALLYSSDFGVGVWPPLGGTITQNIELAPDGTQTADRYVVDTSSGPHGSRQAGLTFAAGEQKVLSFYAKPYGNYNRVSAWLFPNTSINDTSSAVWELSGNGSVILDSANNLGASIQYVGNGWYRCIRLIKGDVDGGTATVHIGPQSSDTVAQVYLGDGISGCYLWGAQIEAGAFPTSYIPTTSAQVTRAADDIELMLSAIPFNAAAGTIVSEVDTISGASGVNYAWAINRSSGITDYIGLGWVDARIVESSVMQAQFVHPATWDDPGSNNRNALAYAVNDCASVSNGASVQTDSNVTLPTGLTIFEIGGLQTTQRRHNGHIKRLKYLPRRATNSELQAMAA